MKRQSRLILATALATFHLGAQVHPFDSRAPDRTDPFQFLAPVLEGVEVVSLGESLHFSREFPLVRLSIIRFLHERMGFDLLAMEGSAEDIWAAQDRLLNSGRRSSDAAEALGGLFSIWNTTEIQQLIEYEAASWSTAHRFYVAAYDIQPGTGNATRAVEVFRVLAGRLRQYAPPPQGFDLERWTGDLAPLTRACGQYRPSDAARVEAGIDLLERWAEQAAPEVARRFPNLPHAAVLRLIPANLRASLALCRDLGDRNWRRYKGVRDTHASEYALQLKVAAPGGKMIVWAHLSHVFHNSGHDRVSVGEVLKRTLGIRLYTIVPFAESGLTVLIYSDVDHDLSYGLVRGRATPLGAYLSRLSAQDYLLDLRSASEPLLTTRQSLWVESEPWPVTASRDFDGLLWIKTVHAPHMVGGSMLFLALTAMHYRVALIVGAVALSGVAVIWLVRRRRRRREPLIC